MGIQSTITITREYAIYRINDVIGAIEDHNYRKIEEMSFEKSDENIRDFVDSFMGEIDIEHIDKWTNGMLVEVMNRPFFRVSRFENYMIL